jgi:hypothetical protein
MGSQLRQSPITESSGHRRADPLGVEVHIQRRPLVVGFTKETGIRRSGHADSVAPMWYGRAENAVRRGCAVGRVTRSLPKPILWTPVDTFWTQWRLKTAKWY